MTETEFLQHTDQLFAHIENQIDENDWDLDYQSSGNVLTIEADDGTQIVINRHLSNQELWLAAKSGGYHFVYQNQQWVSTRDACDFFTLLNQTLSQLLGQDINIADFQAA